MIWLPTTTFSTALFTGFHIYLTWNVIVNRKKSNISIGDGTTETLVGKFQLIIDIQIEKYTGLKSSIRAHGNFVENIPLFLILLGYCEANETLPKSVLQL